LSSFDNFENTTPADTGLTPPMPDDTDAERPIGEARPEKKEQP